MERLTMMMVAAVVAGSAFADRAANREWVESNFATYGAATNVARDAAAEARTAADAHTDACVSDLSDRVDEKLDRRLEKYAPWMSEWPAFQWGENELYVNIDLRTFGIRGAQAYFDRYSFYDYDTYEERDLIQYIKDSLPAVECLEKYSPYGTFEYPAFTWGQDGYTLYVDVMMNCMSVYGTGAHFYEYYFNDPNTGEERNLIEWISGIQTDLGDPAVLLSTVRSMNDAQKRELKTYLGL